MDSKRLKLIALRKERNMFQKDVVYLLKHLYGIEITESYYGMIEQGVRTPKLDIALGIAKLFNVPLEEIFFGKQPNKKLGSKTA
ncbi:helix-turn-helix transcriptional regulator [Aneurinibacillus sp. UBA3580]|jgi:putative transcriptional regulator|uniref:helix-turn-helix transcriptional regulator n=1 Tax=Aneurinibacillus sp. UBA3580 TaxID=1946041 RepID=UPI00257A7CED|nr:helix-turn-helix transcriptional regulator [Aneurinibacillus sp. UBA3580]